MSIQGSRADRAALAVAILALTAACQAKAPEKAPPSPGSAALSSEDDKTIYALGVTMGNRFVGPLKLTPAEFDVLVKGLADSSHGTKPEVDIAVYASKIEALAQARSAVGASAEKAKADPFREAAAREPGAVKTKSGLVFRTLNPGHGQSPGASDVVKVHYQGTLIDGTVFDSSVARGQPLEFPLNGVIPCWTEGLQRMKVGEKARLVCPSDLAYGDHGQPPAIPGGATLVFEVELLGIRK